MLRAIDWTRRQRRDKFLAAHYIRDDGPDLDLERIAEMLNRAPCRPIQYQSPDRLTPALFARAG